jgi:carboxypeptidase family protein
MFSDDPAPTGQGLLVLVLLFFGASSGARAQGEIRYVSIAGVVRDDRGVRLPNAHVVVEGTKFEARADDEGYYEIRGLPTRSDKRAVTLYAVSEGYLPSRVVASRLLPGQIVVYNISLLPVQPVGWIQFVASDEGSYPVYQGADTVPLGRTAFTFTQLADTTFTYTLRDAKGTVTCNGSLRLNKYDEVRMLCDLAKHVFEQRSRQ